MAGKATGPIRSCAQTTVTAGFTLIELLVVLLIIGVLTALAFPVTRSVRQASQVTRCANNLRQVAAALVAYAGANKGAYPPNSGEIQQFWYQKDLIGPHLTAPQELSDQTLAYGVFLCPQDLDDSLRSYSMNVFASGYVSSGVRKVVEENPPRRGVLFKLGTRESSSLILLVESWPELVQPQDAPVGHAAQAIVGLVGTPGKRFGAGGGLVWTDPPGATPGRFKVRASQITFYRHRKPAGGRMEDPVGAANFAFADGHVELLQATDLADFPSGKSRYRALWSPVDREIELRFED